MIWPQFLTLVGISLWERSAFCSKRWVLVRSRMGADPKKHQALFRSLLFSAPPSHSPEKGEGLKMEFMKNHTTWWNSKNIPKIGVRRASSGWWTVRCLPFPQGLPFVLLPSSSPTPLFNNSRKLRPKHVGQVFKAIILNSTAAGTSLPASRPDFYSSAVCQIIVPRQMYTRTRDLELNCCAF